MRVELERIDKYRWRIPSTFKSGMQVPGIVFADDKIIEKMRMDRTLEQCVNVAHLPGIQKCAITLPDGHEGYGFPIGGVAATNCENGVISPGGVGYDINCGVRLLTSNLTEKEMTSKIKMLINTIFNSVPSGLGSRRKDLHFNYSDLENLLMYGAQWIVEQDLGWDEDTKHCEEEGRMSVANPSKVSRRAKNRGLKQVGTLGSGNHFLEIQKVDKIYDPTVSKSLGFEFEGQIAAMIHCGSRGFGHQVCSDYLRVMEEATHKYGIFLPDRELACAPASSPEANDYYQAMACAVNYAFANRQAITHWVRKSFEKVFQRSADDLNLRLVYDVAHNIAKIEEHKTNGNTEKVFVHRKGATRAFPPGHKDIPYDYRGVGQPVFLPGSMGTSSWVLVGTQKAMELSFGSTAHGAGRMMSRTKAKRTFSRGSIRRALEKRGIVVRAASEIILSEEADQAYKNVDNVAEVCHQVGIATKVCRLIPLGVIKG